MRNIKCLISCIVFLVTLSLLAKDFDKSTTVILKNPSNKPIMLPGSFVIHNEYIYLIDWKGADIKIFSTNGNFVNVFGEKGLGPNEFRMPRYSYLIENTLVVKDIEQRKLFSYDINQPKIKLIKSALDLKSANSIARLDKDRWLMAGYLFHENDFCSLAIFDRNVGKISKTLIYFEDWAGATSRTDIMQKIITGEIINVHGFVDLSEDFIFHSPSSIIKIFRIDKKTNQKFSFGGNSGHFLPFLGDKKELLVLGRDKTKRNEWINLTKGVSQVLTLFVSKGEKVCVVFSHYISQRDALNIFIQTYNFEGNLLSEKLLLEAKADNYEAISFFHQKENDRLWILDTDESDSTGYIKCYLHSFIF